MFKIIMLFAMIYPVVSDAKKNSVATDFEYSKIVTVYGMVCAFCSNSLDKKFKKEEAIKRVLVDLESKTVKIKFRKGQSLDDEKIKKMIEESGFKVVGLKDSGLSDEK